MRRHSPTFPLLGDAEDLADGRRLVLRRYGEAEVVEDSPDRERSVTNPTTLIRRPQRTQTSGSTW
jgi:hypothetical protein